MYKHIRYHGRLYQAVSSGWLYALMHKYPGAFDLLEPYLDNPPTDEVEIQQLTQEARDWQEAWDAGRKNVIWQPRTSQKSRHAASGYLVEVVEERRDLENPEDYEQIQYTDPEHFDTIEDIIEVWTRGNWVGMWGQDIFEQNGNLAIVSYDAEDYGQPYVSHFMMFVEREDGKPMSDSEMVQFEKAFS